MKQFSPILFFLIFSCSPKNEEKKDNLETITFDYIEEKYSDTILEKNYIAIFDKETEKKATLSEAELKTVNKNLIQSVEKYNKQLNSDKEKINLRYYFRQYIISKNENGDKIVRVFCFCSYFGDWKNELINVHDGGKCYLNASINLTTNKTEYFQTNGMA